MKISSKAGITDAEALRILSDKMKKRELTFEQQAAYDFLKNVTKIDEEDAKKLLEELAPLNLEDGQKINIINALPSDEATLKAILKDEKEIKKEDLTKILDIVRKYL